MRSNTIMTGRVLLAADKEAGAMPAKTNGKTKNVYRDDEGDVTTSVKKIGVAWYVSKAEELSEENNPGNGSTIVIDEDQVTAVVSSIPGDDNADASVLTARLTAILDVNGRNTLEDLTRPPSSATPLGSLAIDVGHSISEGADDLLTEFANKKMEYDGAPIMMAETQFAQLWKAQRNKDTGLLERCDYVMAMPIIGSREGQKKDGTAHTQPAAVPPGYNGPWDRYKATVNGEDKSFWFLRDVHNSTKRGAAKCQRLDYLKALKNDKKSGSVPQAIRDEFENTDGEALGNAIKTLATEIGNRINRLGRMISFLQQITRWNDMLTPGNIFWNYSTKDKALLFKSTKPIKIMWGVAPDIGTNPKGPISLTQFLAFKVHVAHANGADFKNINALMETVKRKPSGKKDTGGFTPPSDIGTVQMVNAMWEAMEDNNLYTDLLSYFKKDTDEVNENLKTFVPTINRLHAVATHYVKRYNRLVKTDVEREEKAEDATTKAA